MAIRPNTEVKRKKAKVRSKKARGKRLEVRGDKQNIKLAHAHEHAHELTLK